MRSRESVYATIENCHRKSHEIIESRQSPPLKLEAQSLTLGFLNPAYPPQVFQLRHFRTFTEQPPYIY